MVERKKKKSITNEFFVFGGNENDKGSINLRRRLTSYNWVDISAVFLPSTEHVVGETLCQTSTTFNTSQTRLYGDLGAGKKIGLKTNKFASVNDRNQVRKF